MPKRGRGKAQTLDPLSLPAELQTALAAVDGHYKQTYHLWAAVGIAVHGLRVAADDLLHLSGLK
jgi:type III restriction enzyme